MIFLPDFWTVSYVVHAPGNKAELRCLVLLSIFVLRYQKNTQAVIRKINGPFIGFDNVWVKIQI